MRMKKTTRKQLRTIRRRRLALALVGAMAMPAALAQSLPSGYTVVNGDPTIGSVGTQMTVTQTTKGAIIDWGSFNIGAGYGVTFDQQFGASSVTLNRVVGFGYSTSASQIDGTLTSNGNVFIINPAGITFGNNAQVNVGGIVASTLDMSRAPAAPRPISRMTAAKSMTSMPCIPPPIESSGDRFGGGALGLTSDHLPQFGQTRSAEGTAFPLFLQQG